MKTFLKVLSLFLLISCQDADNQKNTYQSTGIIKADSGDLTVHFKKPADWNAVYIHYWGTGPDNNISSDWNNCPPMVDEGTGWFSYTFIDEDEANLLFKNVPGDTSAPNKTIDLDTSLIDNEGWYYYSNGSIIVSQVNPDNIPDFVVHFKKPDDWSTVYIHYWSTTPENLSSNWSDCPEMTDEGDGWFKYVLNGQSEANFLFKRYSGDVGSSDKTADLNSNDFDSTGWYMDGQWYSDKPYTYEFVDGEQRAAVSIAGRDSENRTYTLSTNIELRDDYPSGSQVVYSEESDKPVIRTGHAMFDALFALAVDEVRQNSVEQITDGNFNDNNPTDCSCFETGRLWHYVWTRDISYSVHLALASIDPQRAKNSLLYKVSELKSGGNKQIVQDTGSGGSYPVSSDRVVWAVAAYELLKYLDGSERTEFLNTAFEAITNTIEHDRNVVYDSNDGLYTGEQSFLDWREQSYPSWTENNTLSVGVSKALSTNIAHYKIIDIASKMADELGDSTLKEKYQQWALDLKNNINSKFYITGKNLYSTQLIVDLSEIRVEKYDLLGEAFSVIFDIADNEKSENIIESYPHTVKGAPVMFPQHSHHFVYHNRAIWPFVTAYWLKAAKKVKNAEVVNHNINSLIRGAALNISNMENFEFLSGNNYDTAINSQRQLWSVAGYISMVQDIVFGLEIENDKLRFLPFITKKYRNQYFGEVNKIELRNFKYKGKNINVLINLPAKNAEVYGYYDISSVKLNETSIGTSYIYNSSLNLSNTIEIDLVNNASDAGNINILADNDGTHWAPKEPYVSSLTINNGKIELQIDPNGESNVTYNIYRDGDLVASGINSSTWIDTDSSDYLNRTYSYNVQSVNQAGNVSFPSVSSCYWDSGNRLQIVESSEFDPVVGGDYVYNHGEWHYQNWGDRNHSIEVNNFSPAKTGEYFIQLNYGNGAGPINTGITCAVKKIEVRDSLTNDLVMEDVIMMPHLDSWSTWEESSFARVSLDSSRLYNIKIFEDADSINMSFFKHFEIYTGGSGGGEDPYNYVNISKIKLLFMK